MRSSHSSKAALAATIRVVLKHDPMLADAGRVALTNAIREVLEHDPMLADAGNAALAAAIRQTLWPITLPPVASGKAALAAAIRNVPDFPKRGIQFKDITPLLADASLFRQSVDLLIGDHPPCSIDAVVGIDARGFIFAAAAALQLNAGFVPIRKKGKLPYKTHEQSYELEYGANTLAIHTDAIQPGSRVLLIDDLLATGGTAAAAVALLGKLNINLLEISFLIELEFLQGRSKLHGIPVRSLLTY